MTIFNVYIDHSLFLQVTPEENPLEVQRLGLQDSTAGCMGGELRSHSQKKKKEIPNINSVTVTERFFLTLKKS